MLLSREADSRDDPTVVALSAADRQLLTDIRTLLMQLNTVMLVIARKQT